MKIRAGFVSNSSSSSFLVKYRGGLPKSKEQVFTMLDYEAAKEMDDDSDMNDSIFEALVNLVWSDIQTKKDMATMLAESIQEKYLFDYDESLFPEKTIINNAIVYFKQKASSFEEAFDAISKKSFEELYEFAKTYLQHKYKLNKNDVLMIHIFGNDCVSPKDEKFVARAKEMGEYLALAIFGDALVDEECQH